MVWDVTRDVVEPLGAKIAAQAARITELEKKLAAKKAECEALEDRLRGLGCWTCDTAGKCEVGDDDGGVLSGGICPHWTLRKAARRAVEG